MVFPFGEAPLFCFVIVLMRVIVLIHSRNNDGWRGGETA